MGNQNALTANPLEENPRQPRAGLRTGLLLLLLAFLIPTLVMALLTARQTYLAAREHVNTDVSALAQISASQYERTLETGHQLLISLAQLPKLNGDDPAACNQILRGVVDRLPEYSNMALVRMDGMVACSSNPSQQNSNIAWQSWFQKAVTYPFFQVSDYQWTPTSQKAVLVLSQPLLDADGRVTAILTIDLDLSWLGQLTRDANLPPNSTITLLDSRGVVLARYPNGQDYVGKAYDNLALQNKVTTQKNGVDEDTGMDGVRRLYAFRALNATQSQTEYLLVGIPLNPAIDAINRGMARNLIVLGLSFVLILSVAAVVMNNQIVTPLNAIVKTAQRLAGGDIAARTGIPATRAAWEIPFLANSFDQMAESVDQQATRANQALLALKVSEDRYRRLAENAKDLIFRIDLTPTQHYTYINPVCESMTGYTAAEYYADGLNVIEKRIYAEDVPIFREAMQRPEPFDEPLYLRWVHKDGHMLWTEQRITAIFDESGQMVALEGIVRDVTSAKKAELRLIHHLKELETLNQMAILATQANTLDELLVSFTETISTALFPDNFGVMLFDEANAELVVHPSYRMRVPLDLLRYSVERGVTGQVARTGRSARLGDVREAGDYLRLDDAMRSEVCVPVWINGKLAGVVNAESSQTNAYDEADEKLLEAMAGQLATAMEKVRWIEQTGQRVDQLLALREIDHAITTAADLEQSLNVLLRQTVTTLHADAADILLWDPLQQTMRLSVSLGLEKLGPPPEMPIPLDDATRQAGPFLAILEKQTIYIAQLAGSSDPRSGMFARHGFSTQMIGPVISHGHARGVLEVFFSAPFALTPEWLEFFEALTGQAAIAIDNAELIQRLEQTNRELTLAYDETIEGWSRALDLRDHETEGHSQRVTTLTLRLAAEMGTPPHEMIHIRRGALLHDIGKMGVPDAILLKPAGLTPDEWVTMHHHPGYAHDLLFPIDFLRPALVIPFGHHERWDGSGYPQGLRGEEIPLAARVFAVVDVWDALTSDRPYRKAWSSADALEYLNQQAGVGLDARVVAAFLALHPEAE